MSNIKFSFYERAKYISLVIFFVGSILNSFSQVVINNTQSTLSDCPNNGTITVDATQASGNSLFYEITSGPSVLPKQSSNVLSSLRPGVYTVRVEDVFGDFDVRQVSVGGFYSPISFSLAVESEISCAGSSDGIIQSTLNTFTGKAPYTWELIGSSIMSSDGRYENLQKGVYEVRVTDACGQFDTKDIELVEDLADIELRSKPRLNFTNCGIAEMSVFVSTQSYSPPYTINTKVNNGVVATTTLEEEFENGTVSFKVEVPMEYGDLIEVEVIDNCGRSTLANSVLFASGQANSFSFCTRTSKQNAECREIFSGHLESSPFLCGGNNLDTKFNDPITIELTNRSTGLVELDTVVLETSTGFGSIDLEDLLASTLYDVKITDACGSTQDLTFISVLAQYFKSEPMMIFESGPTNFSNDKEGYEYDYTMSYPDTAFPNQGSGTYWYVQVGELPPGEYSYTMQDTCGNAVSNTFEITDLGVSNLFYEFSYEEDCLGNNKISMSTNGRSGSMSVYNFGLGVDESYTFYDAEDAQTTFENLDPATYTARYRPGYSSGDRLVDDISCYSILEYITIRDYEDPSLYTYNTILCDNKIHVELEADTLTGIGPYEFEIISGPQTFTRQTSNVFELNQTGIYKARLFDACGNATTSDLTVENLVFQPLTNIISCSSARVIYPLSKYYFYEWALPDGSVSIMDTLNLPIITPSDTGQYIVTQHVNINSCSAAFIDTFRLDMVMTHQVYDTICPNTSILFGGNIVSEEGDYLDSLIAENGCDSLVTLHLKHYDYKYGVTNEQICPGGSVTIEGKAYAEMGVFYDTLSTVDCDSILEISISYSDYLKGTYSDEICTNSSVLIEGKSYSSAGVYLDTISNGSCDSIIEITITEVEYLRNTVEAYFCTGGSVTVGAETYFAAQIDIDTITSGTLCDSIITKVITEKPLPDFSLGNDTSICENTIIDFEGPSGLESYLWSTSIGIGSTNQKYTANEPEVISLEVTDQFGCVGRDEVELLTIHPAPIVALVTSQEICLGDTVTLSVSGASTYEWQPSGELLSEIEVSPLATTIYSVVGYSAEGCVSAEQNAVVKVNTTPNQSIISDELIYNCFIESDLILEANWGDSVIWQPGSIIGNELVISDVGEYFVEAFDKNNCSMKDTFEVLNKCVTVIAVPDAFSPNSDGLHDELEVKGKNFTDFEMRIFNRWGEVIFVTDTLEVQWDGTYRGEVMPVGSYPWVINYRSINTDLSSSEKQIIHGSISLIR